MTDLPEPPVKRGPGRPKGVKEKKPRKRREQTHIALQAIQKGIVTNALARELGKLSKETEKLEACLIEYTRLIELKDKYTKNLTRAIKKMASQKPNDAANKVNLNAFIPVDLMREFTNVIEDSPLNRNEIIMNLILNYIKAHKGFSRAELQGIAAGVHNLEKQEYRNTKIAAEMLVNAPYDAVRHHNPAAKIQSALKNTSHDAVYARRVDEKYSEDEVVKALEKSGKTIDMSQLFEDRE